METNDLPVWVTSLDEEDLQLIRRFVLASGSLKQLASDYQVSYPTIRLRVDALIKRLELLDRHPGDDQFETRLRLLVAEGQMEPRVARELLRLHRKTKGDT